MAGATEGIDVLLIVVTLETLSVLLSRSRQIRLLDEAIDDWLHSKFSFEAGAEVTFESELRRLLVLTEFCPDPVAFFGFKLEDRRKSSLK